jgi:hypothetical protein
MFIRILPLQPVVAVRGLQRLHRIHAAGVDPNTMNRFLLSNLQEVLFVN